MKIRNIIATIALMLGILIMAMPEADAQRGSRTDENEVLFWFNVKISKTTNKLSGLEAYQERVISPTIYHGSAKKYQKSLWEGTVHGTKIAVGPFENFEQATAAMKLYKTLNAAKTELPANGESHWFLVKIGIMERSHAYVFEHMAAAVASGSASDFADVLRESLGFKTLAIGPFGSYEAAERAKSLYRVEE